MTTSRSKRGRVEEPKVKLVFGLDRLCFRCKGKGKKAGAVCLACDGKGTIREQTD